jgi:CrcB protein
VIVALGFVVVAAAGACARGALLARLNPVRGLPWGTLVVNVSGSLALGLAVELAPPWLTVVGTGALGTYTTFSTFALEVVRLVEEGDRALAAAYVAVMLAASVAAAWLGLTLSGAG